MRCSIAARRPPASWLSTASGSTRSAGRGWSATTSRMRRPSTACRDARPLAMFAIRPRATPCCATSSLYSPRSKPGASQSPTDTEVVLLLAARSRRPRIVDRFVEALAEIEGAYALVALTNKKLIGARDPLGIRPLVLGEFEGSPILCSETCALDIIGAKFVRDIEN